MDVRRSQGWLVAALVATGVPQPAQGAGFALFEQGARGMGFAGAFTAQADDPSAVFHNPAGIAFLKGKQIYLGGTLIAPKSDFIGADPFPGSGTTETGDVGPIPTPALYYSQPFSDTLALGIGINVPFGLETAWKGADTYSGRFISQKAKLTGVSVNPVIAWKVRDRLAVGGGIDIRFSKLELHRRVPAVNPFTLHVVDAASVDLESDMATGFGFNVGVLGQPTENLRVGLSYRHKVAIDYDGTATFSRIPTGNAQLDARIAQVVPGAAEALTTSIEFPSFASAGVAYRWNDWLIEGDVNWYQWSTFDVLDLAFTDRPDLSETITEDYADGWQFRAGVERTLNERWVVRGGYFFDQSPAPAESVTPLLPDFDRHGLAAGGTWRRSALRLDAGLWYILPNTRSTEGVNRNHYEGSYENKAYTFALSVGYTF